MSAAREHPPVAVVGEIPGPAGELARGLAARGHEVVAVALRGPGPAPAAAAPAPDGVRLAEPWDGGAAADLAGVLDRAAPAAGPVRAAVWAHTAAATSARTALVTRPEDDWVEAAETPLTQFRRFLQGVFAHAGGQGPGSIVVLIPSSSLTGGAAGYVAWAALAEGQRALVRIAARRWGPCGFTVQTVAVTPDLLAGEPAPVPGRPRLRPGLKPTSLPTPPSLDGDVAAVVSSLVGPDWRGVTGATVAVDGGVWMAP